jgi:cell division transport system ATP-binding protein
VIRFDRVFKRYSSGREALAGVSFEIAQGEMVFLTGRSGAGKSSVLRLIALLQHASRGQVQVLGRDLSKLPKGQIPAFRRQLGMVFQDHRLLLDRSVFDNVALPLVVAHTPLADLDKRVRAALDQVGLLDRIQARPLELSVGEQQRVGIARAIVGRPPLLVADEPTGNLDPQLSREIMALFGRLRDAGATVVVASHDMALVHESGLRQIQLIDGRLADAGVAP